MVFSNGTTEIGLAGDADQSGAAWSKTRKFGNVGAASDRWQQVFNQLFGMTTNTAHISLQTQLTLADGRGCWLIRF